MKNCIEIKGLCKSYGDFSLNNINLTLPGGSILGLIGENGAGKTTTIKCILNLIRRDAGEITVDGLPLGDSGDPYARATVVRQEAVLFRGTLRDNLSMYRDIPEERLLEALAGVGLGRFARPDALEAMVEEGGANLSGGEKKRVCLARALLRDTELLILDEPLANLDGETAERIEDLLLSIRDRTLLVVSHQFSAGKLPGFDQVVDMAAGG